MKLRIFLVTALLCLQTALAAAANIPLLPVKDLQAGMKGIGKTVISGDTIEEFDVEIIGVSGKESSGYSILVRLSGPLIEKTGGVAQGMSGSPVYIDGRMVGAVAYGKAFNDPHYCFLTPIGSMLKMLDTPQGQQVDWLPKGTALAAGGFTELGVACLKEELKTQGLEVTLGASGGRESTKPLEPGSSVGAALMTGDLTLGALGTVTWTDAEGRVLAFGHPFMSRGESSFFMNRVWVLGVIPNMSSSYKVGNIGSSIGRFEQDRSSGIAGRLGSGPNSVPLVINVSDTSRGINHSSSMRLIDDEKLLPAIVNAATISCVNRTADRALSGTVKLHFKATLADKEKKYLELDRENMYYGTENLEKVLVQELGESLKVLMNNKFEKLNVYGIKVDAEITEAVQVAEVVKLSAKERKVKAGEKLALSVTLKPFRGKEFTKEIEYTVPKTASGKLVLNVRGGSSVAWVMNLLRKQGNENNAEAPKEQKQKSIKDFINEVNTADKNNSLIIDIASGVKGAAQPAGEAGLAELLKGSPYKKVIPLDFIVDGEKELVLTVEK